ncbi:Retrovirus-related Pol polyprotein from transposon RE1 [Araneus ventricosus]|uniref:Retrovirus-related Pol polyprotein from transposon RE1 n=1 Tax=Araneus ventricosus TaxID=182803 RepID=A0A4Y2DWT0_ARAVE|nr:Retrovirus-related Pol polyprotein from transposon RE1 [Araneus ventricosus]
MIRSLPAEYQSIVQTIYRWTDAEFQPDKIESELLLEENRLRLTRKDLDTVSSIAFSTEMHRKEAANCKHKAALSNPKTNESSNTEFKVKSAFSELESNLIETFPDSHEANSSDFGQNTSWVFDTAATAHFCSNKSLYYSFERVSNMQMTLAVGENESPTEGKGIIHFLVKDKDGKFSDIILKDVLYNPNLRRNLLSGGKLDRLGIRHEKTNPYSPEMNGVAERFNLTALDGVKALLKSVLVPIPKGQLSKLDSPCTKQEVEEMCTLPYRDLLGSLAFIAGRTRPDIMYAVNLLSQFQSNPGIKHWQSLLKLLGYLQSTRNYKLDLSKVNNLNLKCYSDSDFAANRDDRVSIGGYILFLDETPISWRTFKQRCFTFEFGPSVTGMRPTMRKKSKSFLKETLEMLLPMEFSEVLDEEDSDQEETDNGINDLSSDE